MEGFRHRGGEGKKASRAAFAREARKLASRGREVKALRGRRASCADAARARLPSHSLRKTS